MIIRYCKELPLTDQNCFEVLAFECLCVFIQCLFIFLDPLGPLVLAMYVSKTVTD